MSSMKSETCFGKVSGKPLTTYKLRREAKEATEFIRQKYKRDMSPYKCDTCGKWHLGVNSRKTPSKPCGECVDSAGKPKEAYKTKKDATTRAQIIEREMGRPLKVYKCPHGKGWHLTKNLNEFN